MKYIHLLFTKHREWKHNLIFLYNSEDYINSKNVNKTKIVIKNRNYSCPFSFTDLMHLFVPEPFVFLLILAGISVQAPGKFSYLI